MDLLKARQRAKQLAEKRPASVPETEAPPPPSVPTGKTSRKAARPGKSSAKLTPRTAGATRGPQPDVAKPAPSSRPLVPEEMIVAPEDFPELADVPEVAELPRAVGVPDPTLGLGSPSMTSAAPAPSSKPPVHRAARPLIPEEMVVTPEEFPEIFDVPEVAELPGPKRRTPGADEMFLLNASSADPGPVAAPGKPAAVPSAGPSGARVRPREQEHAQRLLRLLRAEEEFEEEEAYRERASDEVFYDPNRATILNFCLGDEVYGLDLDSIKEIIRPRSITDVPRCPSSVLGVIALRGVIVPIVDLRVRLGLPATDATKETRIIIVQVGEALVGLQVDVVKQVVRLPRADIEPPPPTMGGGLMEFVSGVGRTESRQMVIILNVDKIARLRMDA